MSQRKPAKKVEEGGRTSRKRSAHSALLVVNTTLVPVIPTEEVKVEVTSHLHPLRQPRQARQLPESTISTRTRMAARKNVS